MVHPAVVPFHRTPTNGVGDQNHATLLQRVDNGMFERVPGAPGTLTLKPSPVPPDRHNPADGPRQGDPSHGPHQPGQPGGAAGPKDTGGEGGLADFLSKRPIYERLFYLNQELEDRKLFMVPKPAEASDPTDEHYLQDVAQTALNERDARIDAASAPNAQRQTVSPALVDEVKNAGQPVAESAVRHAAPLQKDALFDRADHGISKYTTVWTQELERDPAGYFLARDDFNARFDMLDCPPLAARFGTARRDEALRKLRETALRSTLEKADVRMAERLLSDEQFASALTDEQRAELESVVDNTQSAIATGVRARALAGVKDDAHRIAFAKNLSAIQEQLITGVPFDDVMERVGLTETIPDRAAFDALFPDQDDPDRKLIDELAAIGKGVRDKIHVPLDEIDGDIQALTEKINGFQGPSNPDDPLSPEPAAELRALLDEREQLARVFEVVKARRHTDSMGDAITDPQINAAYGRFLMVTGRGDNGQENVAFTDEERSNVIEDYIALSQTYNRMVNAPVTNFLPESEARKIQGELESIISNPQQMEQALPEFFRKLGDAAPMVFEQIAPNLSHDHWAVASLALNGKDDLLKRYNTVRLRGEEWITGNHLQETMTMVQVAVAEQMEPYANAIGLQPDNRARTKALKRVITMAVMLDLDEDYKAHAEKQKQARGFATISRRTISFDHAETRAADAVNAAMAGEGRLIEVGGDTVLVPENLDPDLVQKRLSAELQTIGEKKLDLPFHAQLGDDIIHQEYLDHLEFFGRWQAVECGRAFVLLDGNNEAVSINGEAYVVRAEEIVPGEATDQSPGEPHMRSMIPHENRDIAAQQFQQPI